jgi:hypothetical protein
MEVPMLKNTRRALHFDSLEGKVLLSAGMADPAATVHRDTAKPFLLNGSLSGLPNGTPGTNGFTETTFPVTGHLASVGAVQGSFSLEHSFIPRGTLPDLAGASLTLENSKGSVQLTIAQANKHQYKFTVVSGTKDFASASGSGTLVISSPRSSLNFSMTLHSIIVKKT